MLNSGGCTRTEGNAGPKQERVRQVYIGGSLTIVEISPLGHAPMRVSIKAGFGRVSSWVGTVPTEHPGTIAKRRRGGEGRGGR